MPATVLMIDDDPALCELLGEYLRNEGFVFESVHSGEEGVAYLQGAHSAEVVVLDIMMSGISGLDVLREIRPTINIPVIMLTGRGDDIDRILGLEMGADDYLSKPCNPRELVARLRAILRRAQPVATTVQAQDACVKLHGLELRTHDMTILFDNTPLVLTSAEYNTLRLLMQSAGQVLSKQLLTEQVLHRQLEAYDRSMDVHISRVRKKLASLGLDDVIKSIRGAGYQFVKEQG